MFDFSPPCSSASTFRWFRASRLALVLALLTLPGILLCGCYGNFALTKTLYHFNGDVDPNGFVQSVIMWVLGFFFIYSIAMFLDIVIFNLIEFWTGDNPMTTVKSFQGPDGSEVVMTPLEDGNTVKIDLFQEGSLVESRSVKKTDQGAFEIQDQAGQKVGNVRRLDNGDLELSRSGQPETRVLPRAALDEFRAQPEFASL